MKYKYVKNKLEIDIKYDDYSNIMTQVSDRTFFAINNNNNKYLPLDRCVYCIQNSRYNLINYKYSNRTSNFICASIWINNFINFHKMDECLIFGNRAYFLESLLYYKIKKIGILPVCIEDTYAISLDNAFKDLMEIYPNSFVIENENTKNKYENIIYYISAIIYYNNESNNTIYYDFLAYIPTVFKLLKKNGNLIFKLLNNNTKSLSEFNIQLIYILSSYFENVEYKIYDYANENIIIRDIVIFEKFIGNENDILSDIVDKLKKNKQIINLINVIYDEKYYNFTKKLDTIIYNIPNRLYKLYNRKKNIKYHTTQNIIDNIYQLKYTININNSINLCINANLSVNEKYKIQFNTFKQNILNEILTDNKMVFYNPYVYQYVNTKTNIDKYIYLTTLAETNILSMYIKIRKKN